MNEERSNLRAVSDCALAGSPDGTAHDPTEAVPPRAERRGRVGPTGKPEHSMEGRGTEDGSLPFQQLDVYVTAKEMVRLVHRMKIGDRELRDQATRAAKSTFLRLSEGLPNEGAAMRRKYFTEANNSLHELLGAIDLAATIEVARVEDASAVQRLGARVKRMLRGLLH